MYRATVTMPQPEDQAQVRSSGSSGSSDAPGQPALARGPRTRGTRQAQALAAALESLPGFCSAQEIHAELRRRGEQVGLATVYRHLQALSERGSVDAIRDANGEILYRQCGTTVHHHHLTCRNCGSSVEVEGRAVEQWADRVAKEAGFTDVDHTVELFGLCPDCARRG
jgi:Fur family transcriptional regulator, ferric uptake regulator